MIEATPPANITGLAEELLAPVTQKMDELDREQQRLANTTSVSRSS